MLALATREFETSSKKVAVEGHNRYGHGYSGRDKLHDIDIDRYMILDVVR